MKQIEKVTTANVITEIISKNLRLQNLSTKNVDYYRKMCMGEKFVVYLFS